MNYGSLWVSFKLKMIFLLASMFNDIYCVPLELHVLCELLFSLLKHFAPFSFIKWFMTILCEPKWWKQMKKSFIGEKRLRCTARNECATESSAACFGRFFPINFVINNVKLMFRLFVCPAYIVVEKRFINNFGFQQFFLQRFVWCNCTFRKSGSLKFVG